MAVTRSLSSPSQILKREARRAQRAGFKTAAEQLYAKGAATGFEERMARSSNIRSAEEEIAAERETQRSTAASNAERAALLRQGGLSSAVTTSAPQRSTNASLNAALPDETATQYYARQRASRLETTPTAPTPASTATVQSPAPATKPATPAIDYLDTSGSPMVEQTREEKDMVRREALQDAYDRLTNPSGEAGSMKEVSAQKVATTPAPPTTPTGPTMEELRAGLRESFDRRNAINRAERERVMLDFDPSAPVVTQLPTPTKVYSEAEKQKAREDGAKMIEQARAREDGARMLREAKAQESTTGARVAGRLIRKVGQISDAAKVGTFMAADETGKFLAKDPLINPPSGSELVEEAKRRKTLQQTLAPAARTLKDIYREFQAGRQGQ